MPPALWIGRLCERFHCLPSQALRELDALPVGTLEEIIEALVYADAKAVYDRATSLKDLPRTGLMQMVTAIDFELAQKECDGKPTDD